MEIILKNITEEIVLKKIDVLLNNIDCCKCEQCRMDIASYALNRLPAKYVATTQGTLLSRLEIFESQYNVAVTAAITQGAMVVKEHPHHGNLS